MRHPPRNTRACQHCGREPADRYLFTTLMRTGACDATKRTSNLCPGCAEEGAGWMERIGLIVARAIDGSKWDAVIEMLPTGEGRSPDGETEVVYEVTLEHLYKGKPTSARGNAAALAMCAVHDGGCNVRRDEDGVYHAWRAEHGDVLLPAEAGAALDERRAGGAPPPFRFTLKWPDDSTGRTR